MDLSKMGDWTRILWTTSHHANHYAMPLPCIDDVSKSSGRSICINTLNKSLYQKYLKNSKFWKLKNFFSSEFKNTYFLFGRRHRPFLGRRRPSCSFLSGRRSTSVDTCRRPFYSPFHHAQSPLVLSLLFMSFLLHWSIFRLYLLFPLTSSIFFCTFQTKRGSAKY